MTKLTWKQTIKLGKDEVVRRLNQFNIAFDHIITTVRGAFFKLCSLLYRNMKEQTTQVIDLASKKQELIQRKIWNNKKDLSKSYDPTVVTELLKEQSKLEIDLLISEIDSW